MNTMIEIRLNPHAFYVYITLTLNTGLCTQQWHHIQHAQVFIHDVPTCSPHPKLHCKHLFIHISMKLFYNTYMFP